MAWLLYVILIKRGECLYNNALSRFKFTIISFLAVASFLFIVGCASPAQKIGTNKYRTECSGMFNSTSECYAEAERVCGGNFTEIDLIIRDQGYQWDSYCQCQIHIIARGLIFRCGG